MATKPKGNGQSPEIRTASSMLEDAYPELVRSKVWQVRLKNDSLLEVDAHDAVVGNHVLYVFDYRMDALADGAAVDVQEQHRRLVVQAGEWLYASEKGTLRVIEPPSDVPAKS